MTSTRESLYDVVVVGAGPAGSICATMLARRGVRVLLCEKEHFPREKICGDCINPKSWGIFDLLGISDEVAEQAQPITEVVVAGGSGDVLEFSVNDIVGKAVSGGRKRAPLVALKRSTLDAILVRQAVAEGVVFRDGTPMTSIKRVTGKSWAWEVMVGLNRAEIPMVRCSIIVGADGRNSRVAHLVQRMYPGSFVSNALEGDRIGVQFAIKRPDALASKVYMFVFNGGYGGIVGVEAGEANVAMVVNRPLARLAFEDSEEFLARTLLSNPTIRNIVTAAEIRGDVRTAFPITPRLQRLPEISAFLVGDARRTTEPFTGEGIYCAMYDGIRVAERISRLLGMIDNSPGPATEKPHLWANRFLSSILRGGSRAEPAIRIFSRYPKVGRWAARAVLG